MGSLYYFALVLLPRISKSSSIGTLYSGTINELEEEVKATLEELLHSEDN